MDKITFLQTKNHEYSDMKIAIICNSTNPDLALFFEKKVKCMSDLPVVFYANVNIARKLNIGISCFNPSSSVSPMFFVDLLFSVVLSIKLFLTRTRIIIFDTAHISNLPIAVLSKMLGAKLVFTIHDWRPHEGKKRRLIELYNKLVCKILADKLIVFSNVGEEKKIKRLNLSGFDLASEQNVFPRLIKDNYFLFFGRIEPYKGLKNIVDISKELQRVLPAHKIVIAGRGHDPSLDKLKALPNVVIINKFLEEKILDSLISYCDSVILPYDSATQSGVVIKAYSHLKPVVAYDVGALSEYIVHGITGYLVQHNNYRVFVTRLVDIASGKYSVSNIRNIFKQKYSNDALRNQYRAVIKEFIRREI